MDRCSSSKSPVPHAMKRLAQRYGVEIDAERLQLLNQLVGHPEARRDRALMRPASFVVYRLGDRASAWRLNLEFLVGRPCWARLVFDERKGQIITFLPPA